jgi:hypothetical protein
MKKMRNPSRLRILFIVAVMIPCLVLGLIAIRSINREEAFIAIRLQRTLEAELVTTVSMINSELGRILDELATSVPAQASTSPEVSFAAWKSRSELVRVPFLLSPSLEIVWPTLGAPLSEDDRMFLNWNREFITDKVPVPVYQNIALAYKDEISKLQETPSGKREAAAEGEEKAEPPPGTPLSERRDIQMAAKPAGLDYRSRMEEAQVEQRALSRLEKDPDTRQQVFDQVRALGQKTEQRNVAPSAGSPRKEQPAPEESIFISEPLRFSEITAKGERGIVPRFIEEKLSLLFWQRDSAGGYVGCVIDDDAVRSRLAKLLPNVYTRPGS